MIHHLGAGVAMEEHRHPSLKGLGSGEDGPRPRPYPVQSLQKRNYAPQMMEIITIIIININIIRIIRIRAMEDHPPRVAEVAVEEHFLLAKPIRVGGKALVQGIIPL